MRSPILKLSRNRIATKQNKLKLKQRTIFLPKRNRISQLSFTKAKMKVCFGQFFWKWLSWTEKDAVKKKYRKRKMVIKIYFTPFSWLQNVSLNFLGFKKSTHTGETPTCLAGINSIERPAFLLEEGLAALPTGSWLMILQTSSLKI